MSDALREARDKLFRELERCRDQTRWEEAKGISAALELIDPILTAHPSPQPVEAGLRDQVCAIFADEVWTCGWNQISDDTKARFRKAFDRAAALARLRKHTAGCGRT